MRREITVPRMSIHGWALLGVMVMLSLLMNGCDIESERAVALECDRSRHVETAEDAISVALMLFGISRADTATVSAELVTFEGGRLPFLDDRIAGRVVWKVTLSGLRLDLEVAAPAFEDTLERTFDVFIDRDDRTLVEISSRWPADVIPMEPEPSSGRATEQMQQSGGEVFHTFPASPPAVSFLDALNTVQRRGFGSPIEASQIITDCVVRSYMGGEPRPVWSITLRGIKMRWHGSPSMPGGSPDKPPTVLNRMRHVVDAETGEWLGASNIPSTESKRP